MRMPVRRALIAATVTALALPSTAAASCLPVCTGDVTAALETFECVPICLDEVYALMDKALAEHEGGDEGGTLCAYAKLTAPPPRDWSGAENSKPPYVWVATEEWGRENQGEYDLGPCIYACKDSRVPQVSEVLDLSGGQRLTTVKETAETAAACTAPLLP